jgi:hypothetical protein
VQLPWPEQVTLEHGSVTQISDGPHTMAAGQDASSVQGTQDWEVEQLVSAAKDKQAR